MENPTGKISLVFRKRESGKTYLAKQYFKLPLQIMMPHYYDSDGTAFVYLLNPGGGILQHDRLLTEITMEEGSRGVVSTPSSAKFYKMDEGYAKIVNNITIKNNGALEYLPEHNAPFEDSEVYQENNFYLEKEAILFATDVVTPGRVSRDELFKYKKYSSKTKIYVNNKLTLYDYNLIEPNKIEISKLGLLEGNKNHGTVFVYCNGMDSNLKNNVNAIKTNISMAASNVTPDLMVIRLMGEKIEDIQKTLMEVWDICRKSILGKKMVRIRKY